MVVPAPRGGAHTSLPCTEWDDFSMERKRSQWPGIKTEAWGASPGGPVAETLCSQGRGLGFGPWSAFPGGTSNKEPTYQCRRHKRHGFEPSIRKIFCRRAWQPTLLFFPGESHGQGAWRATIHSVAKSRTRLEQLSTQVSLSNPKFGKIFLAFESRVCLRV